MRRQMLAHGTGKFNIASGERKIHHKGPSAAKPRPNLGVSLAKPQRPQRKTGCHFDQREKSFSDSSHSLGMTARGRHFAPLRLGGRNFRRPVLSSSGSFASATQILNYSST